MTRLIDTYCADRGVFIIENLDNLDVLLEKADDKPFTVYTFLVNMSGFCKGVGKLIIDLALKVNIKGKVLLFKV